MHKGTKGTKKKVYAVLRIVLLTVVAVVIGVNVYLWNARTLGGNSLPMPFGVGAAVVLSGSMEPALQIDDLIFVKKQDSFTVGDIVVFQDGGSLTVHRLLAYDGETAVTKGDANNTADDPIPATAIVGRICGRVPQLGKVTRVLKTPVGVVVLLGGALLLMEMSFRNDRKEGDEAVEQLKAEIQKNADQVRKIFENP